MTTNTASSNFRDIDPECCLTCALLFSSDMEYFQCQRYEGVSFTDVIRAVHGVCDDWCELTPEILFREAKIIAIVTRRTGRGE